VVAGERPVAEVDPQLFDPPVGPEVGHDRDRKIDSSALPVEMENDLLEAVSLSDDVPHVLDQEVVLPEPRAHLGGECLEGPCALDAPADGVVQLGHDGERLDQRIGLRSHQAVEEGDAHELAMALLLQPRERRPGK
jgi:hypothetical protein